MTRPTLDWTAIRPLNGNRGNGFEELCAQLARSESPKNSEFVRKAAPDAGVECYSILQNGSEWGWQAKYFDALGDSQWAQIDKSVETALDKHPKLRRYFVCVPLDRSDARTAGRKSALDRWNEHVTKWHQQASERGLSVEFIFWGSHELLEFLSRNEHAGRVRFWFDVAAFDKDWFNARLRESLRTAGPRYTPELNIQLPIATEFEAFGRTSHFFAERRTQGRGLRRQLHALEFPKSSISSAVDAAIVEVSSKVRAVLSGLAKLDEQPAGQLQFRGVHDLASAASDAAELLEVRLRDHETQTESQAAAATPHASDRRNNGSSVQHKRVEAIRLEEELRRVCELAEHAEATCGSRLMVLSGIAGVGKTHLLCDVARQRVNAERPTVLLMGQLFISHDAPWTQALQQLDLPQLSAAEFVGALESAAQAANARALVIVDALNEGAGRSIWPFHLEAFLAHLERSEWIGVVLAVRSTYESTVIPAEVRSRAKRLTHDGFTGHEYDAVRAFFVHYKLELPSTPLLTPEFRSPLFLKTLCIGLSETDERRLPRGLHGISRVFGLYLDAINKRLSERLGYDARDGLVRRALDAFVSQLAASNVSYVPLSRAKQVVDAYLPGREFERSLYRGLVTEGLLNEEFVWPTGGAADEVVFLSYDRLSDHLLAKMLLDRHLDVGDPSKAFLNGSPLAFATAGERRQPLGLVEAFCIQVPERTGKELLELAPAYADSWDIGAAFCQSLVWRSPTAISESTRTVLSELSLTPPEVLDVLLTVATVPNHPLNAEFLDRRLRRDSLANRDAWWSVYLHHAWSTQGAVDRLVDWASAQTPTNSIDDEVLDLSALVIAWMLSSSNRFLRDRSTTALVNLLTGRLSAATRVVKRLTDVDDPYVVERLYAVAYGVAMRSSDASGVGDLAEIVYRKVFNSGTPPPHILLRDYARGVIERALYLGSRVDIPAHRCRPPYASQWPRIPSADDIKSLLPDWNRGSHDSGDRHWAYNRIGSSVMNDDFARYVIGTNSSRTMQNWLTLRLDESPWDPPPAVEEALRPWLLSLSKQELDAWSRYEAAILSHRLRTPSFEYLNNSDTAGPVDGADPRALGGEATAWGPTDELNCVPFEARSELDSTLTHEHRVALDAIFSTENTSQPLRVPPRFELAAIQRYILWRVFDLGWTSERFGEFDRNSIGYDGRNASKAERIGKKYQWIAYHEILAYVSDRFQYCEAYRKDGDRAYVGPWQDSRRDIDPSCTMRSLPGGTGWGAHARSWWAPCRFEDWEDPGSPQEWALRHDDLPRFEDLLLVTSPTEQVRWLNGYGYFNWRQPCPPEREPTDVEQRELWYICTAYLIKKDDVDAFLKWAESVDFWGRWMPEPSINYSIFLGEHVWAPASKYYEEVDGRNEWIQPDHGCPVKVRVACLENLHETGGFNCALDSSFTLHLPVSELVGGLGLRWSGVAADFIDTEGRVVVQDPSARDAGPGALLLRESAVRHYLDREGLTLCWSVLGERRVLPAGFGATVANATLRMSGAYVLGVGGVRGFVKRIVDDPTRARSETSGVSILRSGL